MSIRVHPWLKHWLLPGLILGFLWFTLINNLRLEWSVNPQYGYGWGVPFLCLYLLYLGSQKPEVRSLESAGRNATGAAQPLESHPGIQNSNFKTQNWVLLGLALLWLPVRLIEEANPQWRLVNWSLALVVVGLTLSLLWLLSVNPCAFPSPPRPGRGIKGEVSNQPDEPTLFRPSAFRFQDFAFPIVFFLVAVPWPTIVEAPLIEWLTRANTACGIELLNLLGVPAVQHGNLIEVGTGVVGIDEGCSGIRSFQASLMISLFFGELYRLKMGQRILFVLAGFGLAFAFNVARTTLLTWVAARDGIAAIDRWHDTAGVTILLACFISLWLLGMFLSRRSPSFDSTGGEGARRADEGDLGQSSTSVPPPSPPRSGRGNEGEVSIPSSNVPPESASPPPCPASRSAIPQSAIRNPHSSSPSNLHLQPALLCSLAAWLLCCEIAVEGWYRWHEQILDREVTWVMQPPRDNRSFVEMQMPEWPRVTLRATDTLMGHWQETDGTRWQAIYLRWAPGRVAAHLAQGHTPDHCLPASGRKLIATSPVQNVTVHGLTLPVRYYVVEEAAGLLHVAYCQWQDRKAAQSVESTDVVSWRSRLGNVKYGRRNLGERSLELAMWGLGDSSAAEQTFRAQFEKLIRVEK